MAEYVLIASTRTDEEILITGTLQEILQEVENYANAETLNHDAHGPVGELTVKTLEKFAWKLLEAQYLEIIGKEAAALPKLSREEFMRLLSGQLLPPVQARLGETGQEDISQALPFIGIHSAYISQALLDGVTKSALMLWQRAVAEKYAGVVPEEMPQWVSEFTELSTEDIHHLVDLPKKGQAAFRKFERLSKVTSGAEMNNLLPLIDLLKCSYSEDSSVQVAATAALIRRLLTPSYGRYWAGADSAETGHMCERIFWQAFGLVVAQRFSEGNAMSPGVANAEEARRRAGYEFLARVLVRFALYKKAQVVDALGVTKVWLDKVLG